MKTHSIYHPDWGLTECGIPTKPSGFWKQTVPIVHSPQEPTCGNCKRAIKRREMAAKFKAAMQEARNQNQNA